MKDAKKVMFLVCMVAVMGLSGCAFGVGPGGVAVSGPVVATAYYTPMYYNGYVVYYDAVGRPIYYVGGVQYYVPTTYVYYGRLMHHYRVHRVHYHRWYSARGHRYRTYRHSRYRRRPARRPVRRAPVRRRHR